jgi:hypothetical protein
MFMLWPLKLAMRVISLLFTAMLAYFVISGIQVILAARLHEGTTHLHAASTIVVIGSSVDHNAPSKDLQGRLTEALDCYRAHLAPTIMVTGVAPSGGPNVANFEVAWFEQNGVPKSALRPAIVAKNTATQLHQIGAALGSKRSAIIVTDALDAFWTAKVAAHDGITAQLAPAVSSEQAPYSHISTVLAQAGAIAVGRIVGFDRIFWV